MTNQTRTQPIISDEQAKQVFDVLVSLGADEDDKYGFLSHVKDEENYWGGTFEWTDRACGVRLHLSLPFASKVVTSAVVSPDGGYNIRGLDFDQANATLDQVFTA